MQLKLKKTVHVWLERLKSLRWAPIIQTISAETDINTLMCIRIDRKLMHIRILFYLVFIFRLQYLHQKTIDFPRARKCCWIISENTLFCR